MSGQGIRQRILFVSIGAAAAIALLGGGMGRIAGADHDTDAGYYRERAEHYQEAYAALDKTLTSIDKVNGNRRFDRLAQVRIQRLIASGRNKADVILRSIDDQPYDDGHDNGYGWQNGGWNGHGTIGQTTEVIPVPAQSAISSRDFRNLYEAVRNAGYADAQLQLVQAAARDRYFTVDQVISLVGLIGFADTQVDVAAALYPRTLDQGSWSKVVNTLPHQQSRDELMRRCAH